MTILLHEMKMSNILTETNCLGMWKWWPPKWKILNQINFYSTNFCIGIKSLCKAFADQIDLDMYRTIFVWWLLGCSQNDIFWIWSHEIRCKIPKICANWGLMTWIFFIFCANVLKKGWYQFLIHVNYYQPQICAQVTANCFAIIHWIYTWVVCMFLFFTIEHKQLGMKFFTL